MKSYSLSARLFFSLLFVLPLIMTGTLVGAAYAGTMDCMIRPQNPNLSTCSGSGSSVEQCEKERINQAKKNFDAYNKKCPKGSQYGDHPPPDYGVPPSQQ